MIPGRSASPSSAAPRSGAPPWAGGPPAATRWGGAKASSSTSASEKTWSRGRSTKAGPPWGASAARRASSTSWGSSSALWAVAASLVSGRTKGTWSISCREPIPQRIAGARPPSTSIGERLAWAEAIALMALVTPGPAVRAATPGRRVTLAQPSAAKAAACSWRVSTMSMPSARQPS